MKQVVLIFLGALLLLQCTDTAPADGAAATSSTTTSTGSFEPPSPPDLGHVETQALVLNYWVFEIVRDTRNPQNNRTKPGTWYQLNTDGTFTGGQWSQTTHQGSWRFRIQDGRAYLNIDSSIDTEDVQFELQGMSADGDTMSWVSTNLYGNGGMLIKVINLLTIPTKKQFGVE